MYSKKDLQNDTFGCWIAKNKWEIVHCIQENKIFSFFHLFGYQLFKNNILSDPDAIFGHPWESKLN